MSIRDLLIAWRKELREMESDLTDVGLDGGYNPVLSANCSDLRKRIEQLEGAR